MKNFPLLKKHKKFIASFSIVFAIAAFAFLFRLVNLTQIPVFADEAIYIRWSQVMRAEPTLRFVPLSDGKQPLFMWLVIPFLKVFSDPLVAGRMVSVFAGVGTVLGVAFLSFIVLRSKRAAILSASLCAISPFMFFFDRMALADSLLAMFGLWFFGLLIFALKYLKLDVAMIAGASLGGALLTKSPSLFFVLLTPLSLVFAPIKRQRLFILVPKLFSLLLVAVAIGYGLSQIMRLGPNYHMIALRNLDYVFPVSHVLQSPSDPFVYNLDRAFDWMVVLLPFEILILAVLGYLHAARRVGVRALFLVLIFAAPLIAASTFARVFTARYILYTLPPLFVLAGFAILANKKLTRFLVFIFVTHALYLDWLFLTNPVVAPLPQSERSGYFQEWSAGWGIKETADHIRAEIAKNPDQRFIVGTEGYFGTLPDGLQIYLEKVPNVTVIGTGLNFKKIPDQLTEAKKSGARAFFAVNSSRLNREFSDEGLTLVYSYVKPDRTPATHEFVQSGPRETYFLFELK